MIQEEGCLLITSLIRLKTRHIFKREEGELGSDKTDLELQVLIYSLSLSLSFSYLLSKKLLITIISTLDRRYVCVALLICYL